MVVQGSLYVPPLSYPSGIRGGNVVEMIPMDIGFRRFEIKDKIMLLNGERIIVNGVNRHEWNPRRDGLSRKRI